jgi:putative hydrolase of the HAD superfamily
VSNVPRRRARATAGFDTTPEGAPRARPGGRAARRPLPQKVSPDDPRCEKPDPPCFAFARGRRSRDGDVQDDIPHGAQSRHHDIGVTKALGCTVCRVERRRGQPAGGTIEAARRTEPHGPVATLTGLAEIAEAGRLVLHG